MLYFIRSLFSLIATGLTACNNAPEPVQLDTVNEGKPALWKITGSRPEQTGSAYMFGTIHVLPKNITWRTPVLEAAIRDSDRLIIEVLGLEDTQNAAKIFTKLAISPDQPEVEKRINS